MSYIKAETKAGKTLIVEKYYTSRYNRKGIRRGPNRKPTTEAQEKCNQRKTERKLTILINENFTGDDYHLVLDYRPESRPSTPSTSPSERQTIPAEIEETVPEDGRRTKIHRDVRVWEKGRDSPPYHTESLSGGHDIRRPGEVAAWKNPLQPTGRRWRVLQARCIYHQKKRVLERGRRNRQAVFPLEKPPGTGDEKDYHPEKQRLL